MVQLCPRCSREGWAVGERRGGGVYVYFYHRDKMRFYLGPIQYIYALDSDALGLRGVWDPDRLVDYVRNAIKAIGRSRALRLIDELEVELKRLREELEREAGEGQPHPFELMTHIALSAGLEAPTPMPA